MLVGNSFDTIKNWARGIGPDGDKRDVPAQSDDAQLVAMAEELYAKAREDRRKFEPDWHLNLAFLEGQQWVEWLRQRSELYVPPAPPWRIRHLANKMLPVYRTLYGKITAQPLHRARVRPTDDTPDSRQNAEAQDELLKYLWERAGSEEEAGEAIRWAIITGTGLRHPCWDKSLGDGLTHPDTINATDPLTGQEAEVPNPQAGQPVREPDPETGEEDPEGNVVHMGDVDDIAVSPFEFFPEPMCSKIEDMEWVCYAKVRPASYVLRKYGIKMDEEQIAADEYAVAYAFEGGDLPTTSTTRGIVVKELWRRMCPEYPKGQRIVWATKHLLSKGDNPYPKEPIPFFAVREKVVPGRFWGRSVMSDLRPLQRDFNRLISSAMEIRNNTSKPKWHAFEGSLKKGQTISTAPAEIIVTKPIQGLPDGGKPSKITGGDVPASFFQEAERMSREFWEIAGLHDFSKGAQLPGGDTFGGLQLMLEQDDSRLGALRRDVDLTGLKVERAKLRLCRQFYMEPRLIRVIGPDRVTQAKEFYAEKIPDDVEVELTDAGSLPTSWVARQMYLMTLREKFPMALDDPTWFKLLGLADVEGVYDEFNRDTRQAQRENEKMAKGDENGQIVVPAAHDYDNHLIHGREHDSYRKGEEYEQLVAKTPEIADAFAQHVAMHRQLVQQALLASQPVVPAEPTPPAAPPPISPPEELYAGA